MRPPNQHSRIDIAELKAQIVKKLGPERAKQYFYILDRYLSCKMIKAEFDKLLVRILGRENVPLHNQLICSMLKNACTAKIPPPASHKNDVLKHGAQVSGKDIVGDGYQLNGSHIGLTQASGSPGLSNGGDLLPLSPRKARTGYRDRRTGDCRSALGNNGKTSFAPSQSAATQSSDFNVILENRNLNPPDMGRPLQHHQGVKQRAENESENLVSHPAKMPGVRRSLEGSASVYSKEQRESIIRNDGKDASARTPLQAPLGVPLCSVSIGGARRALPPASSSRFTDTCGNGALLDSHTLRERMEQIAVSQNLEGVSMDCANVLNHGLDTYLKGLIRSCIEIAGAKSGHESLQSTMNKHHMHMKLLNGVRPSYQYQMQNSGKLLELQQRIHSPITLQDFRVAMELNPRQLGEDWPLLLEKICTQAFEE